MINIRRSNQRGHFNHGWLDTHHTFSFADYHDPAHMGFRALRVINEDRLAPAAGFGRHPHRDMEILTYLLSGALRHEDSMGNIGVIQPGDVQYMSAGHGVIHSEFNASAADPVHLMQIWILPNERGVAPRYEQRRFPLSADAGGLTLLASPDGRNGSVAIRQDARLLAAALRAGQDVEYALSAERHAWVQVARGEIDVDGHRLAAGDGAAISDEATLTLRAAHDAEVLLFDLN